MDKDFLRSASQLFKERFLLLRESTRNGHFDLDVKIAKLLGMAQNRHTAARKADNLPRLCAGRNGQKHVACQRGDLCLTTEYSGDKVDRYLPI
jgi:hypothetical protein